MVVDLLRITARLLLLAVSLHLAWRSGQRSVSDMRPAGEFLLWSVCLGFVAIVI